MANVNSPSPAHRSACVITGGCSGIGLATAQLLSRRDVGVVIIDRDAPAADLPGEFVQGDVRDAATWEEAEHTWNRAFGGIDFAFLNAGRQSRPSEIADLEPSDWHQTVDVNLGGVITGTVAATRAMSRRGGGSIVITSSLAGLLAYPPDPVYAATKHAVVGFGRAAAHRLKSEKILVNVVCPGLTDTGFLTTEQRGDIDVEDFPLIPSTDVAETVVGLLLGEATGGVWVCQFGRESVRYEPRGVPGPGDHRQPPRSLSQPHAQTS